MALRAYLQVSGCCQLATHYLLVSTHDCSVPLLLTTTYLTTTHYHPLPPTTSRYYRCPPCRRADFLGNMVERGTTALL